MRRRQRALIPVRPTRIVAAVVLVAFLASAMAFAVGNTDAAAKASPKYTKAVVVRIVDGDTIDVKWLAGPKLPSTRVRLIGVNAPESTTRIEPFGKEAASYTRKQLQGRVVWLEKDISEKDRYGRALRYVWLTEPPAKPTFQDARKSMFNARLVAEGYAQVATFPPDVKYADLFVQLQREARAAKKGLWGKGGGSTSSGKSQSEGKSPSQGKAPSGAVKGTGGYNCPKGYPIKGNISSKGERIYHVPGGAYYKKTKPEFCFRTEKDAQKAGFRRSKR